MKVAFVGTSHAARHLSMAARWKRFQIVEPAEAELAFVSEDTPTDENGARDLDLIKRLVRLTAGKTNVRTPIVLTSQVPPGFTRGLGIRLMYHQAETLRMKDAAHRALHPEMLIVGCYDPVVALPAAYRAYLRAFDCPILTMTYEEAEFAKIAINMTLAAQVENTNRLAAAAAKVGAGWGAIAEVLRHDSRVGPHAYLTPGRWQDSPHLVRDWVTLQGLL